VWAGSPSTRSHAGDLIADQDDNRLFTASFSAAETRLVQLSHRTALKPFQKRLLRNERDKSGSRGQTRLSSHSRSRLPEKGFSASV